MSACWQPEGISWRERVQAGRAPQEASAQRLAKSGRRQAGGKRGPGVDTDAIAGHGVGGTWRGRGVVKDK